MKGQITIEYLLAFTIIIGVLSYIYLNYNRFIQPFIEIIEKEDKSAEAFQISELLLNDPGEPQNWHSTGNIQRIGLAEVNSKQNYLSLDKINALNGLCSNYNEVKRLIGAERNFHLFIFSIDNSGNRNLLASCLPPQIVKEQINITISRYAVYQNGLMELMVQI
ncbi:MAG: hypothetical protein QXM68_02640 [Candidatus Aenigmatarchaeota archaeon]|nr:hypothetical protein [Candidatus Aenigmarchaeota archaeon]